MVRSMYALRTLCLATALAVLATACGGGGDKSGAKSEPRVTLTLQMPDRGDELGLAFAAAVHRRSGDSVRIAFGSEYDNSDTANQDRLAQALLHGKADAGYLPARVWATAGVPAFEALLAPFAVMTLQAQQQVATGPVGASALAALPPSVVGVALVPGELRRVLSDRPLLARADFAGLRLNVFDDPLTISTFRALGAQPVFTRERLDGAESTATLLLINQFWMHARYLSSYGVFPRMASIIFGRAAWQRLSKTQQHAIRDAAADVVRSAPAVVARQESSGLRELCAAGVHVVSPTATQLQQIVTAAGGHGSPSPVAGSLPAQ